MAEAFTYATQSVKRLLDEQPDRAEIILAKCYRTYKEVKDEIDSILQFSAPAGKTQSSRSPPSSAIPVPSHGSVRGHRRSSSSQLPPSPDNHRGAARSNAAPTPPGSSSARSSKGSSASGETIYLIDDHEEDIEHRPVVLRRCDTVADSLIREDIVLERILSAETIEEDRHYDIVLPGMAVLPGARTDVRISESVTLTWRRPKSAATHRTKFFLVSKRVLSTDIILGYRDSGEGSPGFPNANAAPQPERQGSREFVNRKEVQSPTVVPSSFHRSHIESMPYRTQSQYQSNQQLLGGHQSQQIPYSLDEGKQQPVQPLSAPTSRSTRPTQSQPSQSPMSIPSNNSETPNRRLRLSLSWDKTPINLWLNLDSSAEVFFQTLQDVSKHKKVHNWNSWVILLKTESQSPDDSAYRLTLGEELDADWDITVDWLQQNKRNKPPHICGSIEFDER